VPSGWIGFPLAMLVSALFAALIGAISLRTRGVYFIMITLAFAQMVYYLVNSVKAYGGDEGLNIRMRSDFGFGINLKNDLAFYYLVLLCLVLSLWFMHRLMHSRFGRVVLAQRDDDVRAEALGFQSGRSVHPPQVQSFQSVQWIPCPQQVHSFQSVQSAHP
jgi:branched-chain amino acid transport system permease protein